MTAAAPVILTAQQVRAAVSMPEAIAAVRQAMLDLDAGLFEQPPRTVLGDGRFLVMAAHHRPTSSAIVKTLSLDFARTPAIIGSVAWAATGSGRQLVAEAGAVTALRTGAIVAVATDLLAPADARRLVLIGAGGQAADQIRAVAAVRQLRGVTVVNRDVRRADRLLDAMHDELAGLELRVTSSAAAAVADADIVCCATSTSSPLFAAEDLPSRVHVNAIGAYLPTMRELPDELLADAAVFVDEKAAALEESGEIVHALTTGALAEGGLVELGSALRRGADHGRERTVFKTVGIAAQDWAIARLLAAEFLPDGGAAP